MFTFRSIIGQPKPVSEKSIVHDRFYFQPNYWEKIVINLKWTSEIFTRNSVSQIKITLSFYENKKKDTFIQKSSTIIRTSKLELYQYLNNKKKCTQFKLIHNLETWTINMFIMVSAPNQQYMKMLCPVYYNIIVQNVYNYINFIK